MLAPNADCEEFRIRGKTLQLPAARVNNQKVIVTGTWLKIAGVKDEGLLEGEPVDDPGPFLAGVRKSGLKADLFTFCRKPGSKSGNYPYRTELDNSAVIPLTTFAGWWEKLSQETRRNVRKAEKGGVTVKSVPFNDELVRGIVEIYNETPVRQGRRFWHYGKGFDDLKKENATYLERSEFIGAYLDNELIGFIKLVYVDKLASIIHILSRNAHNDKRPTNALIAKAVELASARGCTGLAYCKYVYGKNDFSPLTEFKRRNGFQKVEFPRFYVPLTLKGRLVLILKLHHGLREVLPRRLASFLVNTRAKLLQNMRRSPAAVAEKAAL
jgi:hypothetical protein